jgi:hypothetical protein
MLNRSDVRYVAYRMKNEALIPKEKEHLLDKILEVKLESDNWEDFADTWDLFVHNDRVERVFPEKDEVFVNNFCIEVKTKVSMGMSLEEIEKSLSDRERNIYDIIHLNYLGEEVDWELYNKSWGVKIDNEYNKLVVFNKKTDQKELKVLKPSRHISSSVKQENIKISSGKMEDMEPDLWQKVKALLKAEKE